MSVYIIDTSSLIDLVHRYPRVVFPGLWTNVETLVAMDRMVAPWAVYVEIEQKQDDLLAWALNNTNMFKKKTYDVANFALKLANEHQKMKRRNMITERADPFVIALAWHMHKETPDKKPIIVTEECTKTGKIPVIARSYGLVHVGLVEMMIAEQWSFE